MGLNIISYYIKQRYTLISSRVNFCLSFQRKPSSINTLKPFNTDGFFPPAWEPLPLSLPYLPTGGIPPIFQAQLKSAILCSLAQSYQLKSIIPITLHSHLLVLQLTFPYYAFRSHYPGRYVLPGSTVLKDDIF